MNELIGLIAVISAVALPIGGGILLGWKWIKSRNQERMGLINQGIIPQEETKQEKIPNRYKSLRDGIVLLSLGLGFVVGYYFATQLGDYRNGGFGIILAASILFFLGLGYLVFFAITKNMPTGEDKNDNQQQEL